MSIPTKTTIQFVSEAKEIHGDKYDYSNTIYVRSDKKVTIKCPKHGYFWQVPSEHLRGQGCPECAGNKRKTTLEFIEESKNIHGNKYDYSKAEYINGRTKVCIICPTHGEFWQIAGSHISGFGCPQCSKIRFQKLIFGVGINDIYCIDNKKILSTWRSMIERCYDTEYQETRPSYKGCSVCKEWHILSNFKQWYENPENGYKDGYHLDKDILVKGNKIYSPETCCFVPTEINTLLVNSRSRRGALPVGVTQSGNRYIAKYSRYKRHINIGSFPSPELAFAAYKHARESYIKEVATTYYNRGEITKKVYDALMNYKVEITD